MFSLLTSAERYPQKLDWIELPFLERVWNWMVLHWTRHVRLSPRRQLRFVQQVEAFEEAFKALDEAALKARLQSIRLGLRREGIEDNQVAPAFALIRVVSSRIMGMRHHDVQIRGGYVLVHGCITEMDTGEGKTLTATLAAIVMALAGRQVHVVTVNDYLAGRDAEEMAPLYAWFGLTTATVAEDAPREAREQAYRHPIVYCTGKTLVFDYLKDRLVLGQQLSQMGIRLKDFIRNRPGGELLLPGLQFAIVDEIDSVLIDEARTPLIISATDDSARHEQYYGHALALAREMALYTDFVIDARKRVELTRAGRERLDELAQSLEPLWHNQFRREEAVIQALTALYNFTRDEHYIVRDDKVMIVDEHTGRIMPDRSWEKGLHQLIELKEGVPVTPPRVTLAKISFQLFFRRYMGLAGMTGTGREVAAEMGHVYDLLSVRIPPHRPSRRISQGSRVFATADLKWQALVEKLGQMQERGQPVLVGTRTINAADELAERLAAAGIEHQVLHANQDVEEAEIVSEAGKRGRITIATNMAGRGTDIKLADGVDALGGLHVILTELHDSARVDRQLVGRSARQGQPGSWEEILSLEDELVQVLSGKLLAPLVKALQRSPESRALQWVARKVYWLAQKKLERYHKRIRRSLLKAEFQTRRSLSFTGKSE
ncbi:preprotein translocase subunit SecA [Marinobacterium sediminicola]|uniref:Protein translocase subunit SecA n=1 Tax=Marinobacterium sediminicola TaxID=518898 RepID=A0ABY1S3S5_9GAMM|nr:preprotein translocase subunit SecA [Marinobacterium sediminicola]ULG68278.1 preprotein translocase subunit SecA [Marinobacterium sediminicola]SMR77752.1 protein translocase subunit secA [Marinobacterium sediminicola]